MKNKPFLKRIAVMSIVVVTVWLFWPSIPQPQITVIKSTVSTPTIKPANPTPKKIPVKANTEIAAIAQKITANDSATLVAKAYAGELNFPPYSQPLSNQDFDRLEPNYFNPQAIPVDDLGTTISAELSKYRYTYPETVFAKLSGENIDNAELVLVDIASGKSLLRRSFEQNDNIWSAEFDGERNFPYQLQATVKARVNGKNISIALALKYIDSVATLESFDPAFNQDADMVIKANLTTREKGLYRVRANLFDANNQPIAHLVSKEKLNKGSDTIDLKAHQSVLQGKTAPFYLSTFSIELMSPAPGTPTKYGDSAINQFEIKDFATSSLSNIPYQPSKQEQQRLQLLQNMAQGG
ncbi:hypothetical protein H4J38_06930 [Colwellia sp. BRX10-3]|uniref:hypothetical protein n=1 Tax=Colwellia sp. BRX10-3 TaxID=2759844 RepID=UPI0015F53D52|nr:hypothetical protein [Colwellia sp. BRX10-3]MBA6390517.1 hypothetical protein [Colwellia sp. BRX10-3]